MEKGYIHVYTGNGKGKTTAAFGLAVRALCAGKSVYIGQFIKGMKYNEVDLEKKFSDLKIEQYGKDCFIENDPTKEDIILAKEGLKKISNILRNGNYDLVIFDEITITFFYKLLSVKEVVEVILDRKPNVEVVITGRYAPDELIEIADLVTEMKEIKHYYQQGVLSRNGIDK